MRQEITPEPLCGQGRILIEGGCESFGKSELRFLPKGSSVRVEIQSVERYSGYFWNLPDRVVSVVIDEAGFSWFLGALCALLRDSSGEAACSTANRTLQIELPLQSPITQVLREDESPMIEVVDELLHDFVAEVWRRVGGVEGARQVPIFSSQVIGIIRGYIKKRQGLVEP